VPGSRDDSSISKKIGFASPRVGAEFFNRIRLTMDYKLLPKEYTFLGVSLGFVFGGGPKK